MKTKLLLTCSSFARPITFRCEHTEPQGAIVQVLSLLVEVIDKKSHADKQKQENRKRRLLVLVY